MKKVVDMKPHWLTDFSIKGININGQRKCEHCKEFMEAIYRLIRLSLDPPESFKQLNIEDSLLPREHTIHSTLPSTWICGL